MGFGRNGPHDVRVEVPEGERAGGKTGLPSPSHTVQSEDAGKHQRSKKWMFKSFRIANTRTKNSPVTSEICHQGPCYRLTYRPKNIC